MKVGEIKDFLKSMDDDLEVTFCFGDAIAYSIKRIYHDDCEVWLDGEEEDDQINEEDNLMPSNPFD